ncbi:MAG: hydratase, partial [Treponema succinifaciens]|nr:hydratase [Treponema succinifaciens]
YATKRYRSNLINWGMIPFLYKQGDAAATENLPFANGDYIFVPGAKKMIAEKLPGVKAYAVRADGTTAEFDLATGDMTDDERKIIQAGCLINFYRG